MLTIKEKYIPPSSVCSSKEHAGLKAQRRLTWTVILGAMILPSFGASIIATICLALGLSKGIMQAVVVGSWVIGIVISLRYSTQDLTDQSEDSIDYTSREWIVEISHITAVYSVDDLEDFGPGYIVSTSDDEAVFVSGQILGEYDDDGQHLTQELVVTVSCDMDITSVECKGEKIAVAPESVSPPAGINLSSYTDILIIRAADLSMFPKAMKRCPPLTLDGCLSDEGI